MSSYSSRYDDRDRRSHGSSRRDSPPRRDRRYSPGPSRRSRSPSPRNDEKLPQQFGRLEDQGRDPQDDYTVIQKMKNGFRTSPLGSLAKCIDESRKIKVWTRNFKEVRGICTGYVIVFDKHWNLVMKDVDEVHLKPRRAKTPFLDDVKSSEPLPELAPKVPRKKKEAAPAVAETTPAETSESTPVSVETPEKESAPAAESAGEAPAEAPAAETETGTTEKKKKKKKKRIRNKGPTTERRKIEKIFIRGDNIVMIAVLPEEEEEEEDE